MGDKERALAQFVPVLGTEGGEKYYRGSDLERMVEDCERADLAICAVEAYDWDGVSGRLNDWTYEDPRSFTGWNEFRLAANRRVREFAAKLRDRTDRLVTVVIFDRELCERYQRPDQTSHRAGGSDG